MNTNNNIVGLLFAIFLGWCGGYRFYKKQFLLGIIYLFTFGLFGIGWIVDIILSAINCVSDNSTLIVTVPSSGVLVATLNTKVVGVTFPTTQGPYETRQEALESIRNGDTLSLEYYEYKGSPAFRVVLNRSKTDIGNLRAELSSELYKKYKNCIFKIVNWEITGGYDKTYGCNIKIEIYDCGGSLEVETSHSPNRVISYHRIFMLEDVHERCMLNPSLKRHEILSACTLDDKYYLKLSDHRGIHDFLVINDRLNLDIGLIPSELGITFYQYRDRDSEVVMLEKKLFDAKMQFVVYKD